MNTVNILAPRQKDELCVSLARPPAYYCYCYFLVSCVCVWFPLADPGHPRTCRHKSILAYFSSSGLPNSCAALREELGVGDEFLDVEKMKKYEGLLEKKWTSVVRLQKKVCRTPALLISTTAGATEACV